MAGFLELSSRLYIVMFSFYQREFSMHITVDVKIHESLNRSRNNGNTNFVTKKHTETCTHTYTHSIHVVLPAIELKGFRYTPLLFPFNRLLRLDVVAMTFVKIGKKRDTFLSSFLCANVLIMSVHYFEPGFIRFRSISTTAAYLKNAQCPALQSSFSFTKSIARSCSLPLQFGRCTHQSNVG